MRLTPLVSPVSADYALGFRSFDGEVADERLPVEGSVPGWLAGTLVRNGPGKFEVGGEALTHWFDGFALLRRFTFADGAVTYGARFLRSDAYCRAVESGDLDAGQFATPGATGVRAALERLSGLVVPQSTDNANVNVARFGGRHVALTEAPGKVAIDPETLETKGQFAFEDDLTAHLVTAHPHYDPRRGETVGFHVEFGPTTRYRLVCVPDGSARREVIREVPVGEPAYVHSFGLSRDHAVLAVPPYVLDLRSLLAPWGAETVLEAFEWRPERGTRFLVVDRDDGTLEADLRADPAFFFHHVNAYDAPAGDAVVVDLVAYPDASVVGAMTLEDLRAGRAEGERGRLRRYRIPLGGGTVEREDRYEGTEMPAVAPAAQGRPYRYAYGQDTTGTTADRPSGLVKVDLDRGAAATWRADGAFVGEPVFVPEPGADEEDAGVLLAVGLDVGAERSVLFVVDAADMRERARAPLPHPLPFDFHGRFFGPDGRTVSGWP